MSATTGKPSTKKVSATLASMAAQPATTAPAVAETPFDWDSLPAAEVVVYTRNVSAVDYEAVTPAFIKTRVLAAYNATVNDFTSPAGQFFKAGTPVWSTQQCGSPERVLEFMKLAKRYANFLGYTLRGKNATDDLNVAAFCVKPKEIRAPKTA